MGAGAGSGPRARRRGVGALIAALTFDVGGTLVHMWDVPERQFAGICRRVGVELPPAGARAAARAWRTHIRAQREVPAAADWERADEAGLRAAGFRGDVAAAVARIEAAFPDLVPTWVLDPDVPAVLEALRARGLPLGVVSNWDGSLQERLRAWGLSGHFAAVADSGVVGRAKPDPAIFAGVLGQLGVTAAECLHVGDRPDTDVAGARAAGMRPVLYDPLDCGPAAGAPPRIRRLRDLLRLVDAG